MPKPKPLVRDKAEERTVVKAYDLLKSGRGSYLRRGIARLQVWWYTYSVLSGLYLCDWWEAIVHQLLIGCVLLVAALSLWRGVRMILYVFDYL